MLDKCAVSIALVLVAVAGAVDAAERYGLGQPTTQQIIAGWDIDVSPDGAGLPTGHGDARQGASIYVAKCAACHGPQGEGKPMDRLVGGFGTTFDAKPIKTVGSYWPYATTLFDFIRRAMPLDAPQSLTSDEVYALCAYLLSLNKILPEGATLDAVSLPKVEMPNRGAFVGAYAPDRPDK